MLYPQEVFKLEISLNPLHNFVAGPLFTAEGSNVFRFPIGVRNDDAFWFGNDDVLRNDIAHKNRLNSNLTLPV